MTTVNDALLALAGGGARAEVETPAGPILVRGLYAREWEALERLGDRETDRGLVIRYGAVREDGTYRYTDADLDALRRLPIAIAGKLYRRILELSGLMEPAVERGKD